MPKFKYKVRDKEGRALSSVIEAASPDAAADQLSSMGYIPVQINQQPETETAQLTISFFNRVKSQDLILFSRQLATLLSAGIPFMRSMTVVEKQVTNPYFKKVIGEIRNEVEAGSTFSAALEKHPKIFNKLYTSMIRAAETAGILDSILNRLALMAEHEANTRSRIKTAVRYPLIVVVAVCAAFLFLVTFVIPKFASIFARFKTELPLPTRILIGINYAVQHYWYLIIGTVVVVAWALVAYVRTVQGRWMWDSLKLKLPIFGQLFLKAALSRFARVFSGMQKSGLSVMLTLDIVAETVGNVVLARAIETMRDGVREGKTLAQPMEASGLFPPLVLQMVSVGEETGELESLLNRVSDYYDQEVDYVLRNLSTMIEPVLLLFVGIMVLFLALGIFLPMWNMMSLFQR